ncbi:TP53-binding protein 1 [Pleuronectes platessa]|uniref:TP53-binding protein 1 n=1 Tax=Pleuronectes platessa TaxID=8262 RepID=UPI00232A2A6A|nr:TP53-binding protein 1 [Pleuronectes platessa]
MDPGDLDSSLPQPDNPCLIVEDSQPDSVALEDDPESSYRALLARRLSNLQPSSRSPVLELISSPLGSRSSQTDSESSQRNNQAEPGILTTTQEESQVLHTGPPPNKKSSPEETEMDSGADSTTHCQPEEETSQLGFLELSQTQDLCSEAVNSRGGDCERSDRLAEQSSTTSATQDNKSVRSEVSSSSSSDSAAPSGRQLSVQALLHSEGLQASCDQRQQDCELPSSQEDMFDADKTAAAVDSTVSEQEQQGHPTPTPSHTLRLLHLSGQGTLVQESLSQSSADYVAPTPDNFSHTPIMVPSSPTGPEHEHGADEPMDTSLPPEDRAGEREEQPMETDAASKLHPSSSTPVSQNSPGFALDRTLSLPSQPELSHDVFVPTPSLEPPRAPDKKSTPPETESQHLESLTSPLQLCVSTQSSRPAQQTSGQLEDDSQATQIEEFEAVDTSDSVTLCRDQRSAPPLSQTTSKASTSAQSPKCYNECAKTESSNQTQSSEVPNQTASLNVHNVNVTHDKETASEDTASGSQPKLDSSDVSLNICVQETPSETPPPCSLPASAVEVRGGTTKSRSVQPVSQTDRHTMDQVEEVVEVEEEEESAKGGGASGMALALSQSEPMTPEPMEDESEEQGGDSVIVVTDSERHSQSLKSDATNSSQPIRVNVSASTNGHDSQMKKVNAALDRSPQTKRAGPQPDVLKDKSLSDSSGEISFHFTLPKEGELIGPAAGATPPLINQLKQSLRHSTPIELFSEKSDDVAMAASDLVSGEGGEDRTDPGDRKLSLRMKLVTPVGEGSSESFSLQKPALPDEDVSVLKVVSKAVTSSSVFSRVRQVHRQQEDNTPVRAELFASPQRSSQASSLGCNSQSQAPQQETAPQQNPVNTPTPADQSEERRGPPDSSEPPTPNSRDARLKASSQKSCSSVSSSPFHKRMPPQQTSFQAEGLRSPAGRGEPEFPSFRRTSGPAHYRHVRTTQEVRTTITRIITDVYYEDGKEVDRKVSEESEEPVVDCHVLDSDISPCRTGSSSMTSGDLGDISSLSSKASSSSTGFTRPDFIMPSSRGGRSSRGGGVGSLQRLGAHGPPPSSSEDEPFTRMPPPRLPVSPTDTELPSRSDSLRSSPEEAGSASSSFVGLRVVAKWSSNGYFYSGRIIRDAGGGSFRLRFDDGYECEVVGRDILLCDPIPLETEVTALLEDEYFSIGVVRGHKTEGQELSYSVERDGQRQWYNRTSVILSLEQGNRLREQHSLGPYEPSTPLAKASDISLDNLVDGKRRRRVTPGGQDTPNRSPCTPGPSGKRKLRTTSEDDRSPAKRGRKGPGIRAAQRVGVCNTSGSGTDPPGRAGEVWEAQGPLPHNSSLFMGFAFMLTASSESDRLTNQLTEEEEEEGEATSPFNKAYTESQLQAGGGFILPDFNEEQCKAAYQSLLIADQHCRTRKYLLCLASGVPCVSHVWVRDCCKENKLLNYRNYLLPAGVGPDATVVEWHPRCSPFRSLRLLLVFEEPAELWAQLVTMGGASSVRQLQGDEDGSDVPAGKYDAVVTDHACPPLVEKSVTSQDVPLVSPEWLIQSLISGERLGFHSRPQYRHDYSS